MIKFRFTHVSTCQALSTKDPSSAQILASHTLFAPTNSTADFKLKPVLDVPSPHTGTGDRLLLDGHDTAMIRVAVVDSSNHDALVSDATDRITWEVISGMYSIPFHSSFH